MKNYIVLTFLSFIFSNSVYADVFSRLKSAITTGTDSLLGLVGAVGGLFFVGFAIGCLGDADKFKPRLSQTVTYTVIGLLGTGFIRFIVSAVG